MEQELKNNKNEELQSNRMGYETPTCRLVELQSEGCILVGSEIGTGEGGLDDMPFEDW